MESWLTAIECKLIASVHVVGGYACEAISHDNGTRQAGSWSCRGVGTLDTEFATDKKTALGFWGLARHGRHDGCWDCLLNVMDEEEGGVLLFACPDCCCFPPWLGGRGLFVVGTAITNKESLELHFGLYL